MPFSNLIWIADFHFASLVLLTVALIIGSLTGQPAKRLVIAWATTLIRTGTFYFSRRE